MGENITCKQLYDIVKRVKPIATCDYNFFDCDFENVDFTEIKNYKLHLISHANFVCIATLQMNSDFSIMISRAGVVSWEGGPTWRLSDIYFSEFDDIYWKIDGVVLVNDENIVLSHHEIMQELDKIFGINGQFSLMEGLNSHIPAIIYNV